MASVVRALVSKKKRRFVDDGFDLDLTYVDNACRIVAMGFPSTGVEAVYRNPMPEVQRFFEQRHQQHYKIYNLCSEKQYTLNDYFPLVERFGFDDHNPCAFVMMEQFCRNVDAYLQESPENVVAIHCKAGKGRTGLMIATYLYHSGQAKTAEEALRMFGDARTHNHKGVTIPSQMRYVHYYEQSKRMARVVPATYQITHIRMVSIPRFDKMSGGCDPYFHVRIQRPNAENGFFSEVKIYDYRDHVKKVKRYGRSDRFVDLDVSQHNLKVRGDIKMVFYDHDQLSSDDKMFGVWFNTAFVERNYLVFEKKYLDGACKDKHNKDFDKDFRLEIYLHKIDDAEFDLDSVLGTPDVEQDETDNSEMEGTQD